MCSVSATGIGEQSYGSLSTLSCLPRESGYYRRRAQAGHPQTADERAIVAQWMGEQDGLVFRIRDDGELLDFLEMTR